MIVALSIPECEGSCNWVVALKNAVDALEHFIQVSDLVGKHPLTLPKSKENVVSNEIIAN